MMYWNRLCGEILYKEIDFTQEICKITPRQSTGISHFQDITQNIDIASKSVR